MSAAYPVVVRPSVLLLRSVLVGVGAAFAGALLIVVGFLIAAPEAGRWFLIGTVLAAPVLAVTGAAGGAAIHYIRGSGRAASSTSRSTPIARTDAPSWGLRLGGAVAGLAWSGIGAAMLNAVSPIVALASTPLWMMAGVAFTWRVSRATGEQRRLGVALIAASIAHLVAGVAFWAAVDLLGLPPASWMPLRDVATIGLTFVAGLATFAAAKGPRAT